mmetsp:Transcript_48528/g.160824  ORF Transcript_48528/g.160824 Transcript_48528/m.160824 type:complete len:165 (+) Transcript_48528:13-507(+)
MALKAAIARKAAAEAASRREAGPAAQAAPAPAVITAGAPAPAQPAEGAFVVKRGFLEGEVTLYPDGSREAQTRRSRFALRSLDDRYVVAADFADFSGAVGKEDFDVALEGFALRIRGSKTGPAHALLVGLDERVALPSDADVGRIEASFEARTLRITVPRLGQA